MVATVVQSFFIQDESINSKRDGSEQRFLGYCRPVGAQIVFVAVFQGLTHLATDCRPFETELQGVSCLYLLNNILSLNVPCFPTFSKYIAYIDTTK